MMEELASFWIKLPLQIMEWNRCRTPLLRYLLALVRCPTRQKYDLILTNWNRINHFRIVLQKWRKISLIVSTTTVPDMSQARWKAGHLGLHLLGSDSPTLQHHSHLSPYPGLPQHQDRHSLVGWIWSGTRLQLLKPCLCAAAAWMRAIGVGGKGWVQSKG